MIVNNRNIVFRPGFDEALEKIYDYLAEYSENYAKDIVKELFDFCTDRIARYPESYPEYKWKQTPQKLFRKAIFRKHYYVVFKLLPQKIEFRLIVYARRDLSQIFIED